MVNNSIKSGAKIGAIVGGMVWLILGILPGFHFGGYGAIILMNKLFGAVEPTLLMRMFVVCGMVVGIATVGSLCLMVGGLLGTFFGWVVSPKSVLAESYSKE